MLRMIFGFLRVVVVFFSLSQRAVDGSPMGEVNQGRRAGFSLFELLIAMTLVSLLVGLAAPRVSAF